MKGGAVLINPFSAGAARIANRRSGTKRRRSRPREYLTPREVQALLTAAKKGRHGRRNFAMLLLTYRHGFRASEITTLRLTDLHLKEQWIQCRRLKGSRTGVHPLKEDEVCALNRLLESRPAHAGDFVFCSERGKRLSRFAFWRIVSETGKRAGFPFPVYPHQLRHSCGFYLANRGCDVLLIQTYLGHVWIHNTARYTTLTPQRFRGLW